MNTTYILIGVCFLLNLIVVLAFRAADKKDRSLKNLNQQVKNFRFETTSFMNRFTEISRDCEQNITSRIEYANTVQNHLAESIDMVLVHQKELDELSGVCENYGNALKKLKAQTEQAENRVYAVQAEVRKTEAVKDYALQFQKDIERLTSQLDSLKADYVRLVASTEQDLKATSASQKEENREMLDQFSAALERSKSQLYDYVALEKRNYDDMCREQEERAEASLAKLDDKVQEIEEKVEDAQSRFSELLKNASDSVSMLEQRRNDIFSEFDERSNVLDRRFETAIAEMERVKDSMISSITEKTDEMNGRIDEFTSSSKEKIDELSTALNTHLEETLESINKNRNDAIESVKKTSSETMEDLDDAIKSTGDTLEARLNDMEDEVSASIVTFQEKLADNEKAVEDKITDLKDSLDNALLEIRKVLGEERVETDKSIRDLILERDQILSDIQEKMDEKRKAVESTLSVLKEDRDNLQKEFEAYMDDKNKSFSESSARLEADRNAYVQRCREELKDALDDMDRDSNLNLQRIKDISDEFLKSVADRMAESGKAQKMLEETAYGKIKEALKIITDYENKIRESETSLNEKVESVTSMKETIWNLQQEEKRLQDEIDTLGQDRDKLQDETREVRSKRINEEANLVRLKGQQKVIEEKRKDEEKKTSRKPLHSIEEMDLIIGEEEVDVSDDE